MLKHDFPFKQEPDILDDLPLMTVCSSSHNVPFSEVYSVFRYLGIFVK